MKYIVFNAFFITFIISICTLAADSPKSWWHKWFDSLSCMISSNCSTSPQTKSSNIKKTIQLDCDNYKDSQFVSCLQQQRTLDLSIKNDPFLNDQFQKDPNLQNLFKTNPEYQQLLKDINLNLLYRSDSGVAEGYTVGEHSIKALVIFETQKKFYKSLAINKPNFLQNPERFLKYLVAYHDIGKSISIKVVGNNSQEVQYSYPLVWRLMNNSKFNTEESKFAISLIALHKMIGSFLQNKISLENFKSEISRYAIFNKVTTSTVYKYLEILFIADAGSYPYLQTVVFTTDPQTNEMKIKGSEAYRTLLSIYSN